MSSPELKNLWDNIEGTRRALGMSEGRAAGVLGMSEQRYRLARFNREDVRGFDLEALADQAEVPRENLYGGRLDFGVIRARRLGDLAHLPERYRIAARSRKRTSINLIRYVELRSGVKAAAHILRSIQVDPEALRNADDAVSANLNVDICQGMQRLGFSPYEMREAGSYSTVLNRTASFVGALEREARSSVEAIQVMIDKFASSRYDENYFYRVTRLTDSMAEVRCSEREEAQEALGLKGFASEWVCFARGGVIAAFPEYIGKPRARVYKRQCIYFDGAPECVYEFHV